MTSKHSYSRAVSPQLFNRPALQANHITLGGHSMLGSVLVPSDPHDAVVNSEAWWEYYVRHVSNTL